MPKPITIEMLEAMTPDQRKTLYQNALNRATPAAKELVELLDHGNLMGAPKAASTPKRAAKKSAPAKHGRQS